MSTDCRSLVFAHQFSHVSDTIANYLEFINSHQFTIIWTSAKCLGLQLPDRLSRIHNIASGKKNYLKINKEAIPDLENHLLWKPHVGNKLEKDKFNELASRYIQQTEKEFIKQCRFRTHAEWSELRPSQYQCRAVLCSDNEFCSAARRPGEGGP